MRHCICVSNELILPIYPSLMCEKNAIHSRHRVSNQIQAISKLEPQLETSLKSCKLRNFRLLVVLAGDAALHCDFLCEAFKAAALEAAKSHSPNGPLADQTVTNFTDQIMHVPEAHSNTDLGDRITNLLGRENSALIFDAHGAFDPRLLAAGAGTVVGGGLIILLTPPLQHWLEPAAEKTGNQSNFLQRFARKMIEYQSASIDCTTKEGSAKAGSTQQESSQNPENNHVALFIDGLQPFESEAHQVSQNRGAPKPEWQAEQNALVQQLVQRIQQNAESPVSQQHAIVVQADRGRGKSALVGRAINSLLTEQSVTGRTLAQNQISVCSSDRGAAHVLLKHANFDLTCLSMQQAVNQQHDILIVEEAGNTPIAMLEKLLGKAQTTIFVTTVQGYEGAGRGFAIRFSKRLDAIAEGWLAIKPTLPVRWSLGDPAEKFLNEAFLLDIEPTPTTSKVRLTADQAIVTHLPKAELLANDGLLRDVFGLLTQAHYQTTPADLQNLLDKQSLLVFAQQCNGVVTGATLIALEGEIETALHRPILERQRRLNDQIIPQLLALTTGEGSALGNRYARVVRIAIRPELQQQGFGTQLLCQIKDILGPTVDCIGTSFGADETTLSFWSTLGLKPIHYGYKVNPRSGLRSVCMTSSEHPMIRSLIENANSILLTNTRALISYEKSKDSAMQLIANSNQNETNVSHHTQPNMSSQEIQNLIRDYCHTHRSFIDTAGLLLAYKPLSANDGFINELQTMLSLYSQLRPSDRRARETQLRLQIQKLMDW